jgi:hypothetical protein
MDKQSFDWLIKKWKYFNKANMTACATLELMAIRGKLDKRCPKDYN